MSNLAIINGTIGGTLVVSGTSTLGGALLCSSNISSVNSTISANCTVGGNVILSNNIYVSNGTIVISNASMGYLSGVSSSIQTQFSTLNSSTTALYGNVNLLQGYNTGFTSNISTLQTKTSRQSLDAVDNSTGFNGNLNVIGNVNITPFSNNTSLSIYNLRSNNLINTSTGLFSGLLTASNGLTVSSGTLTCGTLTNSGVHTASGISNLAVTNTSGLLTASNGLTVSSGTLTCGGISNFTNGLTVSSGTLTCGGISNFTNGLNVSSGTLTCGGISNFNSQINSNNGITINSGNFNVYTTSNMATINCGGINSGSINSGTSTLTIGGVSNLQFLNTVGQLNIGNLNTGSLLTTSGTMLNFLLRTNCLAIETITFSVIGLYRVSMVLNGNPVTSGSYYVDVLNNVGGGSRISNIFSGTSMTISINASTNIMSIGCSASGGKLVIDRIMTY